MYQDMLTRELRSVWLVIEIREDWKKSNLGSGVYYRVISLQTKITIESVLRILYFKRYYTLILIRVSNKYSNLT